MLQQMLDIQKSFQVKTQYDPHIYQLASAIMAEGGELWAIAGGKWWKRYLEENNYTAGNIGSIYVHKYIRDIQKKNMKKIKEEAIDVLHFLLCVFLACGMDETEVFEVYSKKMGVNVNRQDTGY